jgi:hypothetical protein
MRSRGINFCRTGVKLIDSKTPLERVQNAINMQSSEYVPCAVDLSYYIARRKKVTMAKFLTDMPLQMELQHQVFEELKYIDYVQEFPSGLIFNRATSFKFMPMRVKLPGLDIPEDMSPQYEETEVIKEDHYDVIIKNGWKYYADEYLAKSLPGDYKDMGLVYDEEKDQAFYREKKVFFPRLGPPGTVPFEIFSFGRSLGKISLDLYRNADKLIAAMDALIPEFIEMAVSGIKEPGAPVLIPISRGSNGFISPKQFEKFVLPYILKLSKAIVEKGSPIVFHLDQAWTRFLPYFRQFPEGRYLLHFDGMTDLLEAKKVLGDRMCIQGDVPARLFKLGSQDQVKEYCKKLITTIGKGGGFILGAGCSIPEDAKFENIEAMVWAARNYKTTD